jgi:hypothetical protein
VAFGGEVLLQRVEDFRTDTNGVGNAFSAGGQDHEFLHVDRVVGMLAAIDDVHHRDGQDVGVRATDVTVEREFARFSGGLGDGERHAEDGIGAELALVRGAIEIDHGLIDAELIEGIHALDFFEDGGVDVFDGLGDALAVVLLAAIAQFDGFVGAGGSAGGNGGAAEAAVIQNHIDFDGGVAAAIVNLATLDVDN